MHLSALLLCVAIATALPENWENTYNRYKGFKVYEVVPESRDQVDLLRKWMIEETHFDFWTEPSKNLGAVHIMVDARQASRLTTKCRKHGLKFSVHIDNLSKDIDEFVAKETQRRVGKSKVFDLDQFNSFDDILDWLQNTLDTACDSNGISYTYENAGNSHEGNEIPLVTMSSGGSGKPVYLFDATIHAREWLAPATVFKIMDHVCAGNGDALLNDNDLVFMPVLNPDGYKFSWTNERLWRKNRAPQGACIGVDLNRNCDYMFGEEGVSNNPCSDLYCGPSGNSEPETQVLNSILGSYTTKRAYVTFHSYGQMWMHPWGNTVNHNGFQCERAEDHDDMFAVAVATADAIEETHGTTWARGTSCEVIYETTGATDDYAKAIHEWKYSYTPELRGNSFIIDPSQIQPSFQEVWAGLVAGEAALS